MYSKICVKRPLSERPKFGFQDQLSPNAGQKYCRMRLEGKYSAILSSFIKLPLVIKDQCFPSEPYVLVTKTSFVSFGDEDV